MFVRRWPAFFVPVAFTGCSSVPVTPLRGQDEWPKQIVAVASCIEAKGVKLTWGTPPRFMGGR